jgi:hypothetical protein
VFGFGMVIAGAVELSHNVRVDPDSSVAIVVVGMLTILTIDIFLARLLTKIITASLSSTGQVRPARNHVLGNPAMVQLPQPPTSRLQGVPSVTEGTTRFLETHRTPSEAQERVPAERIEREIER